MNRKLIVGTVVGLFVGAVLASLVHLPQVRAQRGKTVEPQWEYTVKWFSYNPGEKMNDEQRRAVFEKAINEYAADGWEQVGVLLERNVVQTVGGAVVTRDTVSFVTFRRPRR